MSSSVPRIFSIFPALLSSITGKNAALDRPSPLPSAALRRLRRRCDFQWTHASNVIEDNFFTARQTAEALVHGITVGGQAMREHIEAVYQYQPAADAC